MSCATQDSCWLLKAAAAACQHSMQAAYGSLMSAQHSRSSRAAANLTEAFQAVLAAEACSKSCQQLKVVMSLDMASLICSPLPPGPPADGIFALALPPVVLGRVASLYEPKTKTRRPAPQSVLPWCSSSPEL